MRRLLPWTSWFASFLIRSASAAASGVTTTGCGAAGSATAAVDISKSEASLSALKVEHNRTSVQGARVRETDNGACFVLACCLPA